MQMNPAQSALSEDFDPLARLFADAVPQALLHPRIEQQSLWPESQTDETLNRLSPELVAFPGRNYAGVRVVVDWDHRLPSKNLLIRTYASYDLERLERLDAEIDQIRGRIKADNLYPEFDLPDFNELSADEVYVQSVKIDPENGSFERDEVRFYSDWRRQVESEVSDRVQAALEGTDSFQKAASNRDQENQFSQAILVGWAPPCAARSENWALELWLVTHFRGRFGKARVFMVDSENLSLSHSFDTEIQLAA